MNKIDRHVTIMSMETIPIRYKEKPPQDLVHRYEELLDYYLSDLGAKTRIRLYDHPIDIHSFVNGVETEVTRHWIDSIVVNTPEIAELEVHMFEPGIDEMWEEKAWYEAYNIQGRLYQKLNKDPGHPGMGDPFWGLWSKMPRME